MWTFLQSDATIKKKSERTTKEWLGWGLRFPSGPTYRVGLATICAASGLSVSGNQAHDMLMEFKGVFKTMRDVYPGAPTLKKFPARVEDFIRMYPDVFQEPHVPVACRISVSAIRELANARTIPCRSSNSSISTTASPAPTAQTPKEQLLSAMLTFAMQKGGAETDALAPFMPPSMPPRGRLRGKTPRPEMLAIADDQDAGDAAGADPGAQALVLAEEGCSRQVSQEGITMARMGSPAPAPAVPAPSTAIVAAEPPSAEVLRARLDAKASVVAGFLKRKRDVKADDGDDAEFKAEEEGDEDCGASARKRPACQRSGGRPGVGQASGGSTAAPTAGKGKSPKGGKQSKGAAGRGAKNSKDATAPAPVDLSEAAWPKMASYLQTPLRWAGGAVYNSDKKKAFRCYRRTVDKVEKTFTYGSHGRAKMQECWRQALKEVVDDPRER